MSEHVVDRCGGQEHACRALNSLRTCPFAHKHFSVWACEKPSEGRLVIN